MSEPIKVGDLVIVARPPECGCTTTVGRIFTVSGFEHKKSKCFSCRCVLGAGEKVLGDENFTYTPSRLKRIPPLSELESEDRKQEIEA